TDVATEDAGRRAGTRWKDLRRELADKGASPEDMEATRDALQSVRRAGPAACAVVSDGKVLLAEVGLSRVQKESAFVGALPAVGQLLLWRQHDVPYITVACDHAGADICVLGPGESFSTTAGDPDRHDPELHKVPSGGWSHRRYQERVENAWERNAKDVTDALERLVKAVSPRLVIYGGEPRACALLEENSGAELKNLLKHAQLSRAADGSDGLHEVHRAVETAVALDTAQLLAQARELGTKGMTVGGPGAVLEALTASQVDVLLVHEGPQDQRTAFLSRSPLIASLERGAIDEFDAATDIVESRLTDVALAAAFLTGASVRMVPASTVDHGLRGLLRYR
ncbi:MAG TPA: Vms1/Ankzf1 family peptidyl-tRNA hydrolase, partial [Acidimicrobiales bacterium]|nr:Vms1/Ankzf1 family peptidyl-tRNA hydrolase [Acidimicrobiales bacterium]